MPEFAVITYSGTRYEFRPIDGAIQVCRFAAPDDLTGLGNYVGQAREVAFLAHHRGGFRMRWRDSQVGDWLTTSPVVELVPLVETTQAVAPDEPWWVAHVLAANAGAIH